MKIKRSVKRAFWIAAWAIVAGGMFTLLIAASRKQQEHVCRKVAVVINGSGVKYAIDKSDIIKLLQTAAKGRLENRSVGRLNPAGLEAALKTNRWIGDADVYFDSQDVLHVAVSEKTPVARMFTVDGASYYIDSAGKQMPLLDKISIRLPVFTNYPLYHVTRAKDSALMAGVKALSHFINNDTFWSAQIAQVDITEGGMFEAVPVIGRHIIVLGSAEDLDKKFGRLFLFYQKVLAKTGFDKYSRLDVQYNNQVVATRNGEGIFIDSIQLQKNVQELLEKNSLQLKEEEKAVPVQKPAPVPADSINTASDETTNAESEPEVEPKKIMPAPIKMELKPATKKPLTGQVIKEQKKPKAVMPKQKTDDMNR